MIKLVLLQVRLSVSTVGMVCECKEVSFMSKEEKVILTNMCMVYDANKVLVQDRLNKNWKGLTFPGGHIEKHESFTDAVIREVKEETGLTIENPKLCGIKEFHKSKDGKRYIVFLYIAKKYC